MDIESLRANKFRLILRDGMIQISSDVCLAKTTFLNVELIEKILEPLSWAIQNDYSIIRKVYKIELHCHLQVIFLYKKSYFMTS